MRSETVIQVEVKEKKQGGCCSSGGCNKLDTFDYLEDKMADDPFPFDIYEISFKNGARKDFVRNQNNLDIHTGDWVVVSSGSGYDIGEICLSGELVRLQMKKKKVKSDKEFFNIQRIAGQRDLEKLTEARAMERGALKKAKEIATSLKLDMKVGDVEYQGDKRKATFFYTADGRIDFRELVKLYAKEFRVKIEMRQIGIRQESSRIGGIASCGREVCCSSWLTNFSSVTTETARYQNLAINQSKLTGLCGRLKCCLNFELDTYMEALAEFPKDAERVFTKQGTAYLVKMDIFKGLLFYSIKDESGINKLFALHKNDIGDILEMNKRGEKPDSLGVVQYIKEDIEEDVDYETVTGQIELPDVKSKSRNKNRRNKNQRNKNVNRGTNDSTSQNKAAQKGIDKTNPEQKQNRRDGRPQNPNQNRRAGGPKKRNNPEGGTQNPKQNNPEGGAQNPKQNKQEGIKQNQRPKRRDGGPQNRNSSNNPKSRNNKPKDDNK